MSVVMGVTHQSSSADPTSPRTVESDLRVHLNTETSDLRVIVVIGDAGNGVRTLVADRVPQLTVRHTHVVTDSAWPRCEDCAVGSAVLACPSTQLVPTYPPPEKWRGSRIVIGCHDLEALPDWVRQLPPQTREFVALDRLSHAELQDFLTAHLGGPVLSSTLRDLGSSAGFVPSVITAMVRVLVREGILEQLDGTWSLVTPIDARLFTAMLSNRIAGFDLDTRELFLRLCLVGSAEVSSFDANEHSLLQHLRREGFIALTAEHGAGHRAEVRARLFAETGQLLVDPHTAAQVLRGVLHGAHPTEQAVLWGLRHGEDVCADAIMQVIQRALDRHEWSVANQLAALAHEAAGDDDPGTCDLLVLRAVALRFLDESQEALACLSHAESIIEAQVASATRGRSERDSMRTRSTIQRAEILHYQGGDLDAALDALEHAEAGIVDGQLRGDLIGHQALHLIYGGRFSEGAARMEQALQRPHRGHRWIRTRLSIAHCFGLVAQGQMQRAVRRTVQIGAHQLIPLIREAWVAEELAAAYFVSAFRSAGPAKLPRMMRRFEGAEALQYRPDDTSFLLGRATWLLACGKVGAAAREAATCFANVRFHDPSGLSQAVAALRAQTAALMGERHVARTMITTVQELRARSSAVIAGGVTANIAATEYLLGDPNATEHLLARVEEFCNDGNDGFAAEALHSGVRFGDRRAAARLIDLAPRLEGALTQLHVRHARAVLSEDPVALSDVGDELNRAGLPLHALEAYHLAGSLPGVPDLVARRTQHESQALREQLGEMVHPLAPQAAPGVSPPLTKREREVQELIVHGLSNREIADRLSLSHRTVEGHVSRLYQKTGQVRRDPSRRRA